MKYRSLESVAPRDKDALRRIVDERKFTIERRVGCAGLEELGEGTYGVAYVLGDGRVLKATTDESEATASSVLVGKKLENVVQIYDVFTMSGAWFIVQERLRGIGPDPRNSIDLIKIWIDKWFHDLANQGYSFDEILKECLEWWKRDDKKLVRDILHGVWELWREGIVFYDVSRRNTGMRGSDYVIFDLGVSSSTYQGRIDVVEKKE